jgi:hypothetical protein
MSDKVTIDSTATLKALMEEKKTATKERQVEIIKQIVEIIAIELKPEATEMVNAFENDELKTTKDNYGKYMQALSAPELKGVFFFAMVKAMRDAGAGEGLDSAVKIIRGEY